MDTSKPVMGDVVDDPSGEVARLNSQRGAKVLQLNRAQRRKLEREQTKRKLTGPGPRDASPMTAPQDPSVDPGLPRPAEALGNAMRLVDAAKQHGGKPGIYAIAAEDQLGNVTPQGVVLVCQGPMADLMIDQFTQVMIAMDQAEFWPPQAGLSVQIEGILEEKRRAKLGILVTDKMPPGPR